MNGWHAVLADILVIVFFCGFALVLLDNWRKRRRYRDLAGSIIFALMSAVVIAEFLSCAATIRHFRTLDAKEVAEIDVGSRAITGPDELQTLVSGLNDCHWFLPERRRNFTLGLTVFQLRLKSGHSYSFFVGNEYGKQAILVFADPGKGIKWQRGYAGSQRLLGAMREVGVAF
jgi:hypothetical protein